MFSKPSENYALSILVNGRPITEYFHEDNFFVEGRYGSEFQILINNHTNDTIEAVVSVDGLSINDGKDAGLQSTGYIINPYGEITLDGWMTSLQSVNKFVFSDISGSYRKRSGKGSNNTGVIGAMIFRKKQKPIVWANPYPYVNNWISNDPSLLTSRGISSSTVCMNADASVASSSMGTGWGDAKNVNFIQTTFERAQENPDAILALYYDDRKGLEKRGIVFGKRKTANAFPAYESNNGFCKAPK